MRGRDGGRRKLHPSTGNREVSRKKTKGSIRSAAFLILFSPFFLSLLASCWAEAPWRNGGGSSEEEVLPLLADVAGPDSLSLQPRGAPGVEGTVHLLPDGDSLTITVEVARLPGEGYYPTHLHGGTCAEPGGEVLRLNPVQTDYRGVGGGASTVDRSELREGSATLLLLSIRSGGEILACAQKGELTGRGPPPPGPASGARERNPA